VLVVIFSNNNVLCNVSLYLERNKIQSSVKDKFQRILMIAKSLNLNWKLEKKKKELETRRLELEKHEAHNESERNKLAEEMEGVWCLLFAPSPLVYYD